MALLLHSSSSSNITDKLHLLLLPSSPHYFLSQSKSKNLSIKCKDPSSSSNSSDPTTESTTTLSKPSPSASSAGLGFGNSTNSTTQIASKKKQKGKIIRRAPLAKPSFDSRREDFFEIKEKGGNERGFVIGWIGFGAVIILEGIVLASSGFLPQGWDKFLVKYLYPSFTPTVFLFVAGTAAYGLRKYLQNNNNKTPK